MTAQTEPIDLPALRAVIAGVRQRKARILGTLPDNFTTLMDVQAMSVMKDDLTTLASACERLAEENERMRGEVARLRKAQPQPAPSKNYTLLGGTITPAPAGKGDEG